MKLWRKVLLQALFYFCSFMAIICLLNMVFSDGIDDWQGEIIKGTLHPVYHPRRVLHAKSPQMKTQLFHKR